MTFDFSPAVAGFGTWIYDDRDGIDQTFQLIVTDGNSQQHTSPVLAAGTNAVEGFIGVTSPAGIVQVIVVNVVQGAESTRFFELDHVPRPGH